MRSAPAWWTEPMNRHPWTILLVFAVFAGTVGLMMLVETLRDRRRRRKRG